MEQRPSLPPIEQLNRLPRAEFEAALRLLFEAAPPLAEALHAGRPFDSYESLLARAEAIMAGLSVEQKIEVINAHPRIGERAETVRERSALSHQEQGYAAEAALEQQALEQVYHELAELNRAYEERFGFRFVVFVNQRAKADIVPVLRARLERSREEEMAIALREMMAIARDRLRKLSSDTGWPPDHAECSEGSPISDEARTPRSAQRDTAAEV